MSVDLSLDLRISAFEQSAGDLGTKQYNQTWGVVASLARGTGASQTDKVWTDSGTAAASANTVDLMGSLTDINGATISFAGGVVLIAVKNTSTTTGYNLTVGAGSNPFAGWSGAGANTRIIKPGGFEIWYSPIDDVVPVAGTGDIITLDPGANTVTYDIMIVGRSA